MTIHDDQGSQTPEPIPATPAEAINFACGVLDVMSCVCSTLVGSALVEPAAFQAELEKRIALWRANGNASRAAAAELFVLRLKNIERAKREVAASIVNPATLSNRVN
jgi:hypothetical protein